MKIGWGVAFAVVGLLILALGGRRSRGALVTGCVSAALGAYLIVGGMKALRLQKMATSFIAAAERGDMATVRRMADDEPLLVNASQTVGASLQWPLTASAKALHPEVVEFLLSRGAIVDAQTDDGSTPLHETGDKHATGDEKVTAQRVATIKVLLAQGAKVDSKDDQQRTPLMTNAQDAKAVALLIGNHADVKARDNYGRTALHYAVGSFFDHSDSVAVLLDHGAEVDARDSAGETPFQIAANAEDIETLVTRGADPKVIDKSGQTALHRIARTPTNTFRDLDTMAVLCACGLRPDAPDHNGATPWVSPGRS